jgi:putative ATP-dependent endonuclease of OLD family
MKIKSIHIENFRSFQDETIEFGDYNCLVGPNGAGKSTVLNALNIFFRESKSSPVDLLELSKEDFHYNDTSKPVRITVTFVELSANAKDVLKDYIRHDQLVVMAVAHWSEENQSAPVVQKGLRLAMNEFAPFFKALGDGKLVAELKGLYTELRKNFPDLPAPGTKGAMTDALKEYEGKYPDKCILIESDDEFYGVTKGAHKLGPFIQWIFIPAVKEATEEQIESKDTALGRLIERTVRAKVNFSDRIKELRDKATEGYDALLKENQPVLDGLSASLKTRLTKWAHPGADLAVKWDKDPAKSVRVEEPFAKIIAGECGFFGELGRFGHGFRRSFLLALLEELAGSEVADAPRLLLGIEEPELFQHPPQAQYLAEILHRLSEANAQLFACTHSPYFVVGKGFEDIRLVRKPLGTSKAAVSSIKFQDLANHLTKVLGEQNFKKPEGVRAKIHQTLQSGLREMFFAPTLILVEGLEDLAYIQSAFHLLGLWDKWRASGADIVPVNGKSFLVQPLAIAQLMKIPTFIIFDADGNETNEGRRGLHQKDNERLVRLLGQPGHDLFPAATSWNESFIIWPINLGVAVEADYVQADWQRWKNETEAELGQPGGLDKNSLLIAGILSRAWDEGKPSATLKKVCEALLKFAEKATS